MFNKFTAISTPPNRTTRTSNTPGTPFETPLIEAMISEDQDVVLYLELLFDSLQTIYKHNVSSFTDLWDSLWSVLPALLEPIIDIFTQVSHLAQLPSSNYNFKSSLPPLPKIQARIKRLREDLSNMQPTSTTQSPSEATSLPCLRFQNTPKLLSSTEVALNYVNVNIQWLKELKSAQKHSSSANTKLTPLWNNLRPSLISLLPHIISIHENFLELASHNDNFFSTLSVQFDQDLSSMKFLSDCQADICILQRDLDSLLQQPFIVLDA